MKILVLKNFIAFVLSHEVDGSFDSVVEENIYKALIGFLINSLLFDVNFLNSFLEVVGAGGSVNILFYKMFDEVKNILYNTNFFENEEIERIVNFIYSLSYFIYRNELSDNYGLLRDFTFLILNYCDKYGGKTYIMRGLILLFRKTSHVDTLCARILLSKFNVISDSMFKNVKNENFEEFLGLLDDMLFSAVSHPADAFADSYKEKVGEIVEKLVQRQHYNEYMKFVKICGGMIIEVMPDVKNCLRAFFTSTK